MPRCVRPSTAARGAAASRHPAREGEKEAEHRGRAQDKGANAIAMIVSDLNNPGAESAHSIANAISN